MLSLLVVIGQRWPVPAVPYPATWAADSEIASRGVDASPGAVLRAQRHVKIEVLGVPRDLNQGPRLLASSAGAAASSAQIEDSCMTVATTRRTGAGAMSAWGLSVTIATIGACARPPEAQLGTRAHPSSIELADRGRSAIPATVLTTAEITCTRGRRASRRRCQSPFARAQEGAPGSGAGRDGRAGRRVVLSARSKTHGGGDDRLVLRRMRERSRWWECGTGWRLPRLRPKYRLAGLARDARRRVESCDSSEDGAAVRVVIVARYPRVARSWASVLGPSCRSMSWSISVMMALAVAIRCCPRAVVWMRWARWSSGSGTRLR